ncbi:hypothetical protein BW13_04415 [Bifidobacterium sp. UTCIF-37]|uniref:hypothetical protein n=1 Tax=Bifidobacterium sp. UTCIF-38 TaxID=1465260 RepID=UPI001129F65E|nr:hypothetical protein [Bifidobacterium sp. UTCIF-38]TPF86751.1 hypothetical protein BW13_04415 [Bifidobacterium sp. UTCIF-37]TPF89894.1 hypothetical protein BW11_04415 [Bifidobacterium sp. UTCIF-38]
MLRLIFKSAMADRTIPVNLIDGATHPIGRDDRLTKVRPHNAYMVEQLGVLLILLWDISNGIRGSACSIA